MIAMNARATWVLYRRSLNELVSLGPQTLVVPLLVPCFILLAYPAISSVVFSRIDIEIAGLPGFGSHVNYVQYLIAAPVVMASLLATASAGVAVAVERQLGFYDRMRLSPLGPRASQVARRLGDGTRIAAFVVILTFVGWATGVHVSNWPLALTVTVVLTTSLGMAYGGITFSLCLRSGSAEAAQAVTPLFLPALFLSTAFVPLPLMPDWLRPVAEMNPLSAVCDSIRLADAGRISGPSLLKSVAGIGALAASAQIMILRAERRVGWR